MKQKVQGLKKEFKRKDVERMRNLIQGKAGDSSEQQIGYTKKRIDYKEGDIWTEGHKTWTIKNGIKQTVSKLDKVRKETLMPLCCPECNNIMKKPLDKSCYKTHKKCLDCVNKDIEKLMSKEKLGNSYDSSKEFHRIQKEKKLKANIDRINDMEAAYIAKINQSNNSYVSEQGDVERWVGNTNTESLIKEIKKTAKIMRKKFNKELKNL